MTELHRYAENGRGSRNVGFRYGSIAVLVQPDEGEHNEAAWELATLLAGLPGVIHRHEDEAAALRKRIDELKAQIPPTRGAMLMGRGYVRFTGAGQLWLLSNRVKDWGHTGFHVGDWDNLFRCWNVRVVEHGTDEHGPWWAVENLAEPSTPTTGGTP